MDNSEFLKGVKSSFGDVNADVFEKQYLQILRARDGHIGALSLLNTSYFNSSASSPDENQVVWEIVGLYLQATGRIPQAIQVYEQLYEHILEYQIAKGKRLHKGMPLVRISDLHLGLGRPATALRYLMYTLC